MEQSPKLFAINPFHVGSGFTNYCIKQGWLVLEMADDKRMHYYLTELGKKELAERYQIEFDCPCALEPEGFADSL